MYESYKIRNNTRYLKSYKAMTEMMTHNSLVKIKEHPSYSKELEGPVLLNSLARASLDKKTNQLRLHGQDGDSAQAERLKCQGSRSLSRLLSEQVVLVSIKVHGFFFSPFVPSSLTPCFLPRRAHFRCAIRQPDVRRA